jgi:hypothetical protein
MPRLARRRLISQFCKVDLHDLKDGGWRMYLPAGFVRATEDLVLIDWRGYQFLIPLVRTFPHFGGTRFWFECPLSLDRLARLSISNSVGTNLPPFRWNPILV